MSTPEEIDSEFMKLVSKAKQLLAVDYVDELKDKQASMLREVLAELMVYVQQKIDQETAAEEASPETAETGEVAPAAPVSPSSVQGPFPPLSPTNSSRMMSGGRSKKQKRKQKGGDVNAAANIDRVLNIPGPDSKNDPHNISSNSRDTIIGSALHPPFTAGRVQQISSMGGLSDSEKQNMLPNMGGQSGGGRKKKPSKK